MAKEKTIDEIIEECLHAGEDDPTVFDVVVECGGYTRSQIDVPKGFTYDEAISLAEKKWHEGDVRDEEDMDEEDMEEDMCMDNTWYEYTSVDYVATYNLNKEKFLSPERSPKKPLVEEQPKKKAFQNATPGKENLGRTPKEVPFDITFNCKGYFTIQVDIPADCTFDEAIQIAEDDVDENGVDDPEIEEMSIDYATTYSDNEDKFTDMEKGLEKLDNLKEKVDSQPPKPGEPQKEVK